MHIAAIRKVGTVAVLASLIFAVAGVQAQGPMGAPNANSAFSIPQKQLIQPAELNSLLAAKSGDKPLVLQVGSRMQFDQAHISGSEYAGPGSQASGLEALKKRVASVPKDKSIVIYCGCCPWNRCPNIAPAFRTLQSLGFTHVKALYIADNFGSDWLDKGYPVDRGH
jgi:thiosulfate/3-mercaptopyruvate sulfurtransferase